MPQLSLVFAGSPQVAIPSLRAIAASEHEVRAVITRADSPHGRRRQLEETPVAIEAAALGLPVIKANRADAGLTKHVEELSVDLGVIVAYGALLREPLLSTPRLGWINLHFSLLPRWRGAAPVQHAVMAGDDITGATVFQLTAALDAGEIYGQLTQAIGAADTAGEVLDSLAESGANLLARVIDSIASGSARPIPQVGDVTLAPKLTIEDARVRWNRPAEAVLAHIRGVTPEPGAFTTIAGSRVKILEAVIQTHTAGRLPGSVWVDNRCVLVASASHPLELRRVQPAGKKPMPAQDWWRGAGLADGVIAE